MRDAVPAFLNGIFSFEGAGYEQAAAISDALVYTVPADRRSQLIYFRAGNSSDAMIVLKLMRNGTVMRLFPVGAKAADHIPLAVLDDLPPDTVITLALAAPSGCSGHVALDLGLMEI